MTIKAMYIFTKSIAIATILSLMGCSKVEEKIEFKLDTFKEASLFEKNLGSQLYAADAFTPVKGFYPRDTTYTIKSRQVFIRPNEGFLPITTKYYKGAESDSIRFIIYEWNVAIPGTDRKKREELLFNELPKFDQYHQKYIELVKRFKKAYGKPIEGDGIVRKKLTIYPIWKAHLKFEDSTNYIDLDWVWIPSNDARIFKIIAKAYPKK